MEYWKPRRPLQPNDFQMDENRLFGGLNCLGPITLPDLEDVDIQDSPLFRYGKSETFQITVLKVRRPAKLPQNKRELVHPAQKQFVARSEERRVGKECW